MSFSYKTENFGLPIWGSNDKPTQDDLNYQNNQIDKKFNEKAFHNISELKNTNGNFLSLEIISEPISKRYMYYLTMKGQYDKNAILRINCGVILKFIMVNTIQLFISFLMIGLVEILMI